MIFERRAYTMEPGHVPAFDQAQIDRGFDPVKSYMDRLVGYFSTRTGPVDQVVHLYRYDSFDDWNQRLRGLYSVPEMTPYFVNTRKIVRKQINGFFDPLPVDALNPLWAGGKDWLPETGHRVAPLNSDIVVEERVFQLRPGGVPAFVEACNAGGSDALSVLGDSRIGALVSAVGPLHQVSLWWWFANNDAREQKVGALQDSTGWHEFVSAIAPAVTDQSSLLLQPRPVPEMSPLFG